MKILFSVTNLKIGGGQIVALRLANFLNKKGHTVHIYDHFPDFRNREIIDLYFSSAKIYSVSESILIRIILWKINAIFKIFQFDFMTWINQLTFRRIAKNGYNIIHSHMYESDLIVAKSAEYIPNTTKLLMTMHGCYEERLALTSFNKLKSNFKLILKTFEKVAYLTDKNISFINLLDIGKSLVFKKIYNGIDLVELKKYQNKSIGEPFIFGMVGRGIKEKGWLEAIQAIICLKESHNKDVALHIVGDSEYLESLKSKFKNKSYISFLGSQTNPFLYIQSFSVGLLPSYSDSESLPTTIMEYMGLNIPTIATDIGEIKNMIINDELECGIVINLNENNRPNTNELTKAMLKLANDSLLYSKLKSNCATMIKKFDINTLANKYLEFYEL